MSKLSYVVLALCLVTLAFTGCDKLNAKKAPAPGAPKLEFYVMSQCPYGVQVENAIKPVLDKLGNNVDFHLEFIVTPKGDGKFDSLHGQAEVDGNIIQLCVNKLNPDKMMDFVLCQNKNVKEITTNWKECAKQIQVNEAAIETCRSGEEGKKLLAASAERASAAKAQGSPTIKLNGKDYNGGRRGNDFMRAICEAHTGTKPQVCNEIPAPVKVNMTVLSDARCADCKRAEGMVSRIQGTFPGLEVKRLDYMTDEGKALYKEAGLKLLPAFLFDESVEKDTEGYQQFGRYLEQVGKYKSLKVGATFDPTAEICDNKVDDTGDGKVDCDDDTCKNSLACRKEMPKRLDVFVMSQCPFGVKALDSMKEVLTNFENKIDFNVNFIATEDGDGFKALHGQPEVDENIRELCAIKNYPKNYKYMDYIWCRNKNIRDTNWKSCTGGTTGIDTAKIEKCSTGDEGKKLLRENIKIGQALGVTGSPTWLANNRFKFSGVDAETIKKNVCSNNAGLKGCEKTLSSDSQTKGSCGQ